MTAPTVDRGTSTRHITSPYWHTLAPCATVDPDLWFANKGHNDVTAAAKRICGSCRYKAPCLLEALDRGEEYGVFGGLTADERRALRAPRALDTTGRARRDAAILAARADGLSYRQIADRVGVSYETARETCRTAA